MRRLLIAVLCLIPVAAFAEMPCKYTAPRTLQLDLTGVGAVQIELHSYNLHLTGTESAHGLTLNGRACASSQSALSGLQVTQHREGDQLLLDVGGDNHFSFNLFGDSYTYLDINLQLPAQMPVTLSVGSGDATVSGLRQLHGNVGSGDLHLRQSGRLDASVGSGDVDASDIESLELGSVGSGDFKADGIKGDATLGSIGSGDVTLRHVGGSVRADTLGSGDLGVHGVAGDFTLGAKGSGDVSQSDIKGKVSVPHDEDD